MRTFTRSVGLVGIAAVIPAKAPAVIYRYIGAWGSEAPRKFLYGSYSPKQSVEYVTSLANEALVPLYIPLKPSWLKTLKKLWKTLLCSLPCPAFASSPWHYIRIFIVSTGCIIIPEVTAEHVPRNILKL